MQFPLIGILALQGDYEKHAHMLHRLGARTLLVKTTLELEQCDALVLPGGESTTLRKLMQKHAFWEPVRAFCKHKPVFATCAGAILLGRSMVANEETFGVLNATLKRNAYGRQIDSFIATLDLELSTGDAPRSCEGVFIRAPKFVEYGDGVRVLASWQGEAVMLQQGNLLAATFHPELSADTRIHSYFFDLSKRTIPRTAG